MTLRLAALHLRSRRAAVALGGLVAVAVVTWLGLALGDGRGLTTVVMLVMPLGAAVLVGTSARSPFGDVERTASFPLPALRLGHLGGLLACGALLLAVANTATPTDDTAWSLVRNGAGYAGLGLLASRLLGAGLAWVPPVMYGTGVLVARLGAADSHRWWMWPVRNSDVDSTWVLALALLAVGLLLAVAHGAQDEAGEAA